MNKEESLKILQGNWVIQGIDENDPEDLRKVNFTDTKMTRTFYSTHISNNEMHRELEWDVKLNAWKFKEPLFSSVIWIVVDEPNRILFFFKNRFIKDPLNQVAIRV